jgi:hypothetical protein
MHFCLKTKQERKMGLRAYLFSCPMVVEYDYGSLPSSHKWQPSKFNLSSKLSNGG